jgi:hypothetical protein
MLANVEVWGMQQAHAIPRSKIAPVKIAMISPRKNGQPSGAQEIEM